MNDITMFATICSGLDTVKCTEKRLIMYSNKYGSIAPFYYIKIMHLKKCNPVRFIIIDR